MEKESVEETLPSFFQHEKLIINCWQYLRNVGQRRPRTITFAVLFAIISFTPMCVFIVFALSSFLFFAMVFLLLEGTFLVFGLLLLFMVLFSAGIVALGMSIVVWAVKNVVKNWTEWLKIPPV